VKPGRASESLLRLSTLSSRKLQEITISSLPTAVSFPVKQGKSLAVFVLRRDGEERDIAECEAFDESVAMVRLGKLIGHGLSREGTPGGTRYQLRRKGGLWGRPAPIDVWTVSHIG
jgi:hypothetical protein